MDLYLELEDMSKILIVEDDPNLLEALKYNVRKEGYEVFTAIDGVQALEVARRDKPDLILLDIMLPKMSGFEVCRILRKEMTVPILMLTARDDEVDKVVGLDLGADDYMTKPFSMRELLARIRAMLRRAEIQTATPETPLKFGDIEVDISHHVITKAGNALTLPRKSLTCLLFWPETKALYSVGTSYWKRSGVMIIREIPALSMFMYGGCGRR